MIHHISPEIRVHMAQVMWTLGLKSTGIALLVASAIDHGG